MYTTIIFRENVIVQSPNVSTYKKHIDTITLHEFTVAVFTCLKLNLNCLVAPTFRKP